MGIFFNSHLAFYPLPSPERKAIWERHLRCRRNVFFIRMCSWECRLLRILLPLSCLGSWLKHKRPVSGAKWTLCAAYYDRWTWVLNPTALCHVLGYNTSCYLTFMKGCFLFHCWKSEAQHAVQILNESQHLDMSRLRFPHFS